jgi:adenine C2-methylase RlmN of 23S rRNA A2503 and tRNA A37
MIEEYNDSGEVAQQLVDVFKPFLAKFPEDSPPIIKISNYNYHGDLKWKGLSKSKIDKFEFLLRSIIRKERLEGKLQVKRFESKGGRIKAGCGHFASRRRDLACLLMDKD